MCLGVGVGVWMWRCACVDVGVLRCLCFFAFAGFCRLSERDTTGDKCQERKEC